MNSMHKSKDTELEIENKSPVFKLQLFNLHMCFPLFRADSMIRFKLHIRKEGTLLQNVQHCSCDLVGMSCPRKIRCFHKRFCICVWQGQLYEHCVVRKVRVIVNDNSRVLAKYYELLPSGINE